jgi:hypothetical protein
MIEQISTREGAALFVQLLERHDWQFSLTARGDLQLIVGDDHPPRWPQQKILAVLDAMANEIRALLAARDGLDGIGDESAIH